MENDNVLVHYATKADLQEVRVEMALLRADLFRALNAQTWKLVSVVLAGNAATIGAVFYMLNS